MAGYSPVYPESDAVGRFRWCSYNTIGRAGTTGQVLGVLNNPSGSGIVAHINLVNVDTYDTALHAVGTAPAIIRIYKRSGSTITGGSSTGMNAPVKKDSVLAAPVCVTYGDMSGAFALAATALSVGGLGNGNISDCLSQEYASRLITQVGNEPFDKDNMLENKGVILRPNESLVARLNYTVTGSNPATKRWQVTFDWWEGLV